MRRTQVQRHIQRVTQGQPPRPDVMRKVGMCKTKKRSKLTHFESVYMPTAWACKDAVYFNHSYRTPPIVVVPGHSIGSYV